MERRNIEKNGRKKTEYDTSPASKRGHQTIKRAAKGHWSIESMHLHLDVTFREAANAAQNLDIIRK